LRNERMSEMVRGSVAQALATMHGREALPDLRALLRDKRVDAWVRRSVRDGLWTLAEAEKIPIRF
jgi:HEAT repeat protein